MKLQRTKNAKRNLLFGGINRIIVLFLPFILRTVIIHKLGAEYLGLGSLFNSILNVLNITELGFSSAIVFSMYKAIAEDDKESLCVMLCFFRKVYKLVGLVILVLGITIMPFIKHLIKGSYPNDINIYVLYCLYLFNTVISYFMFAYRSSLLNAYQRNDIISNIDSVAKLAGCILQFIAICCFKNFYFYVISYIISTISINVFSAFATKRIFPDIVPVGKLSDAQKKDIKEKIKGLMISKITGTTRNTFDSIFISAFLGLLETAIYNNYYLIMNGIIGFFGILMNSISAGIGNSVATETKEKNFNDLNNMNFIYMWISGWCSICLIVLYQPFTELFFGKEMLFPFVMAVLFSLYFYLLKMSDIVANYRQASGLWWENRYASICEAVCNIVLNWILGRLFGVYGILCATLISIFVFDFGFSTVTLFRYYFDKKLIKSYYAKHLLYFLVTFLIAVITYSICIFIKGDDIPKFIVKMVVCAIVPNILYLIFYKRTKIYKSAMPWFVNIFNLQRFKFLNKILLG